MIADPKAGAKALMVARDVSRSDAGIKDVPGIGKVRFITDYDVPWLAGSSNRINPKTGHPDVYGQHGIDFVKLVDGKRYDFALPLIVHELDERAHKGPYTVSHPDAKRKERAWVQREWPELGIERYDRLCDADIAKAKRIARSGSVKIPPELVKKPYLHPRNPLDREMYQEVFGRSYTTNHPKMAHSDHP